MKISTIFSFIFFISYNLISQDIIQKTHGKFDSNEDRGESIIITNDGGSLITGKAINPTTQYFDAFLLKLDAQGQKQWYKTFESAKNTKTNEVIEAIGGGYVFCGTEENDASQGTSATVWKTNEQGNLLWKYVLDSIPDEGFTALTLLSNGNYLVAGYRDGIKLVDTCMNSYMVFCQINDAGVLQSKIMRKQTYNSRIPNVFESVADQNIKILWVYADYSFGRTLTLSITTGEILDTGDNSFEFSLKSKAFKSLIDNQGRAYLFLVDRFIKLQPYRQYDSFDSAIGLVNSSYKDIKIGIVTAKFYNQDWIELRSFTHTDNSGTLIETYLVLRNTGSSYLKSSVFVPLKIDNLHSVVPNDAGYLLLFNDTLSTTGEMDVRVMQIGDSVTNFTPIWEQSYGHIAENHNETFIKNCKSKSGNQMVLAHRYQPDFQYYMLVTDENGNQLYDNKINTIEDVETYKFIDIQPTLGNGCAILVSVDSVLRVWKISALGELEFDKKVPILENSRYVNSLIIRPNGFAIVNNINVVGGQTILYLFDENLILTNSLPFNEPSINGYFTDAICLENGTFALLYLDFIYFPDNYMPPTYKFYLLDSNGLLYAENSIPFGITSEYFKLKVLNDGFLIYPNTPVYETVLTKTNFAGDKIWSHSFKTNASILNQIIDIQETTFNDIVIAIQEKIWFVGNPDFPYIKFRGITRDGEEGLTSCLNPTPVFGDCPAPTLNISDYSFSKWQTSSFVNHTTDLLFEKISYPKMLLDLPENRMNILENPTSNGQLNIDMTNDYEGDFNIEIFNYQGQPLKVIQENKTAGNWQKAFSMNTLQQGTYFIRAKVGKEVLLNKWLNF
jgi:Secretion system C-terminal sorting domain